MLPCDALISWLVHFKVTGSGWSDFKSWPDLLGVVSLLSNYMLVYKEGKKKKEREEGVAIDIQVEVREMGRGSCSLCQSWQIHQLPVRCGEEGRRGRRGRLKDPLQAGRRRRKRRRSLLKSVAWSFLVDGRSRRTPFDWWMISYLTGHRRARLSKGRFYFMNTVGTSPDVW